MQALANIFWLGTKELRSLRRDTVLIVFLVYSFSISVYSMAGIAFEVHNASVAVVDEDRSQLSDRIRTALYPPYFQRAIDIASRDVDRMMDNGRFTFVIDIPPNFASDLLAGRGAELQIIVDATAVMQAFVGASYLQKIIADEVGRFVDRSDSPRDGAVTLEPRFAFNPNLTSAWFTSIMGIVQFVSMLGIILSGAALIREREYGTIDHLLVMPVSSVQIAFAKIWSNGLVIVVAATASMFGVVEGLLGVPIAGSIGLFLFDTAIYLFFATSLGIFLATIARTMPQLGLLAMLVVVPLNMLSGTQTPIESQPDWLQHLTLLLASRHYVSSAQAILYRGAGVDVVWPQLLAVAGLGLVVLLFSLRQFRRALTRPR